MDSYYDSSYIDSFRIYYRAPSGSGYTSYFSFSTSNVNLIQSGRSFKYTITTIATGYNGEHVMWVRVYRYSLTRSSSYSAQLSVDLGKSQCAFPLLSNSFFFCMYYVLSNTTSLDVTNCIPVNSLHATNQGQPISIEMNIKLWPSQTCHEFSVSNIACYIRGSK